MYCDFKSLKNAYGIYKGKTQRLKQIYYTIGVIKYYSKFNLKHVGFSSSVASAHSMSLFQYTQLVLLWPTRPGVDFWHSQKAQAETSAERKVNEASQVHNCSRLALFWPLAFYESINFCLLANLYWRGWDQDNKRSVLFSCKYLTKMHWFTKNIFILSWADLRLKCEPVYVVFNSLMLQKPVTWGKTIFSFCIALQLIHELVYAIYFLECLSFFLSGSLMCMNHSPNTDQLQICLNVN